MAVQSLSSIGAYAPNLFSSSQNVGNNSTSSLFPDSTGQQSTPASNSVDLSAEFYSSDSLSVQFSNKDGDTVTLNMQQVEYAKAQLQVQDNGTMSDQDWQSIVAKIKDEFKTLESQIMNQFAQSMGGNASQTQSTPATPDTTSTQSTQDAAVPAYWNADNTSQRIVDFATSFLKGFQGAGSDFLAKIKDAIEAGFSQAKDALGKLPDSVSNLVQDTHDLVMSKLDAWAKAQGIDVGDETSGTAASSDQLPVDSTNGTTGQSTNQDEQVLASLSA